jgi:DNA-binding NarL/FixJ family response regulator
MRIVIAEDAALFRAGLVRLLEDDGHQVCAAIADGDALLAAVARYQPDVVIADIRMPPTYTDEGLRAALELRRTHPGTMAEGRSNAGIATTLVLTLGTVEKHVASIFGKLGLPASESDNRRVLAVLRYLGS